VEQSKKSKLDSKATSKTELKPDSKKSNEPFEFDILDEDDMPYTKP